MVEIEDFARSFKCSECGKNHQFTMYVLAHWGERLLHTCDCGAQHSIRHGRARLVKRKKQDTPTASLDSQG